MLRSPGFALVPTLLAVLKGCLASTYSIDIGALYGPGLSPGAEIFYASDSNFSQEVLPRYYDFESPVFYGAIKPVTEADVAYIVCIEHPVFLSSFLMCEAPGQCLSQTWNSFSSYWRWPWQLNHSSQP